MPIQNSLPSHLILSHQFMPDIYLSPYGSEMNRTSEYLCRSKKNVFLPRPSTIACRVHLLGIALPAYYHMVEKRIRLLVQECSLWYHLWCGLSACRFEKEVFLWYCFQISNAIILQNSNFQPLCHAHWCAANGP